VLNLAADCLKPGPAKSRGRVCFKSLKPLAAKPSNHAGLRAVELRRAKAFTASSEGVHCIERRRVLHGWALLNINTEYVK
jgi:hypothetical protein